MQLIRLSSSGKNALDFALAYYVGRAVSANPAAYIHIVSKDTGFDPLIEHLRSRHFQAHRHDSFATFKFSGTGKAVPETQKAPVGRHGKEEVIRALERLRKNVTNRPKKKKTLLSHLKPIIGKDATDMDALWLVEKLRPPAHRHRRQGRRDLSRLRLPKWRSLDGAYAGTFIACGSRDQLRCWAIAWMKPFATAPTFAFSSASRAGSS